jgi:hypothetical protein
MILSQVSKHLSWFLSLEGIECFDCVFGVFAFALVLNEKCRRLGWLEWWWLGGIYSPNHYSSCCCRWAHQTIRWCTGRGTVHCPVHATSVDRWGLEWLTIEVICPLVAPDSPVRSDFYIMHCSLFTAVDRWAQLTITPLAHRTCPVHTRQFGGF